MSNKVKTMNPTPWTRLALLSLLAIGMLDVGARAQNPDSSSNDLEELSVYRYRMKGKVRLLLFWVGRDDVGGGQISLGRTKQENGNTSHYVEVFFGSNPERVPGGINRWGYGQETAQWATEGIDDDPTLQETLFEGFMKHSMEKGFSEALANEAEAKGAAQYWYEGVRSLVRRDQAVTELRKFSTNQDFDYRHSQSIRCHYEKRLLSGPDKNRKLTNTDTYRRPYGFLTAVNAVIRTAVREYAESRRLSQQQEPLGYVYNARPYELAIRSRKLVKRLEVPAGKGKLPKIYPLVAKIDFRLRKMSVRGHHDFTLWFPLEGDLQGIPVRILDRPRWWLGIELNLEAVKGHEPVQRFDCHADSQNSEESAHR